MRFVFFLCGSHRVDCYMQSRGRGRGGGGGSCHQCGLVSSRPLQADIENASAESAAAYARMKRQLEKEYEAKQTGEGACTGA